jgi:5-methylcytosine-specific restriction endonuclease McrA
MSRVEFQERLLAAHDLPLRIATVDGRNYWTFLDWCYWENDDLDQSEIHALLAIRDQRDQARIERAQAMVAIQERPMTARRGAIPDDVRQFVYTRDGGRCQNCGSPTELQFDHIIPVALGGASSAENLQLLCGPCNRRKSAGLTIR